MTGVLDGQWKIELVEIEPRSLHCAARRATIRRAGEDRAAPVGMTEQGEANSREKGFLTSPASGGFGMTNL